MAVLEPLREWALRPIDMASLGALRIAFGVLMLIEVLRYALFGWIGEYYIDPAAHFTYLGFGWVRPWPGMGMYIHFAVLGLLSCAILVGWRTRRCLAVFSVGFAYIFLLDQAYYLNHLYLVSLIGVVLMIVPSGLGLGLDGRGREPVGRGWMIDLVRFQVGLVYVFAGVSKCNSDWLNAQPLKLWMKARAEMPVLGPFLQEDWVPWALSYGGLTFDLLIVPGLLWRRTRVLAFIVLIAFHMTNVVLFHIGIFPWLAIGLATVFFSPDWPRRFIGDAVEQRLPTGSSGMSRWLLVGVALWCLVQIGMPLRHLLYSGNVAWTEQGHRFSWRMKLRSKVGRVRAHALNRQTGERIEIKPKRYYSRYQVRKMSTRPDMILQFARRVRFDLEAKGHEDIVVHIDARARLNGRPSQVLIDPQVDLSRVERTLGNTPWIVPQKQPLPGR